MRPASSTAPYGELSRVQAEKVSWAQITYRMMSIEPGRHKMVKRIPKHANLQNKDNPKFP